MPSPEYKTTHPMTRMAWRNWLEKNHLTSPGIWFVYFKKETGKRTFSYADAVEEALCFGWIDSLPRKLDAERTMLKFTPRKPKSMWSKLNKTRIKKLIETGKMQPAGLQAIKLARNNGSWDALSASDGHAEKNTIPDDLHKALAKTKNALAHFTEFPPGYRKQFLYWIDSAKQDLTRKARIKQTVLMAKANKKPGPKGFKI